tara:strand:+ start:351 stop:1616 length:1266 start_codon:yes stop_codon:yes gene_type:complete
MKRTLFSYWIFLIFFLGTTPSRAQKTINDLPEFHRRDGLPNFFEKVKSGKPVSIAYLGGSITEASNGWRDLTFNKFQSDYANTEFTQINAAIGGTGSNLGVFRLERDVLLHDPDLVFVEFAVNDGNGPAAAIHKSMEGIVRKIWKHNPMTDICFVYTIAENVIKPLQEGTYQISAAAMEQIAQHYGIPSIHMGVEVIRLMEQGKLIFTGNPEEHPDKIVFTKDRTHPLSASGHPIYAQVVDRNFAKMKITSGTKKHQLKKPFDDDNWENAQMIPLTQLSRNDQWSELPPSNEFIQKFSRSISVLSNANSPGASFTIQFKGKVLGVYDLIGPQSGIVEVVVDNKPATEITRFDAYCNYYRRNAFFIKDLSEGLHTVTFTVTGKEFDKAAILAKRNIPFEDPENYQVNSWLVNNVLLVGDWIK